MPNEIADAASLSTKATKALETLRGRAAKADEARSAAAHQAAAAKVVAEAQAEAIVTTFGEAVTAQAATKIDIADLRADLARFETRFTNKLYAGIATLLVLSKALDFLIGP